MEELVKKYLRDFKITCAEYDHDETSPLPGYMEISLPTQIVQEIKKKGIGAEEFSRQSKLLSLIKKEKIKGDTFENPRDVVEYIRDEYASFEKRGEKTFLQYYEGH